MFSRYFQLLRSNQIDLVHAHGQDAAILAAAGRFLGETPLVITRHVLEEPADDWRQRIRARLALAAFRKADAVIAVSSAVADCLAELTKMSRSRVEVIHNGIELERFDQPDLLKRRGELRRCLGFTPDGFLILCVSVLRPGKGHDTLLAALPKILEQYPNARLLLAGSGPEESNLRLRARAFGECVAFLGNQQDIPELLAASNLVVLPSYSEALPTCLIEALAAKRPVVATRVGGTEEIIQPGKTGLLVPARDPGALAEAIVSLLGSPTRAQQLALQGQRYVKQKFSIDFQVEKTHALWDRVLSTAS